MDLFGSEQLVINNQFSELKRLHEWVQNLSERMGLSTKAAFHFDLVLEEAVTNIISYAYESDTEHSIIVRLIDDADSVIIELIDDGKPFNPLTVEQTEHSNDLETVAIGGWGLQLVKNYTRSQSYHYSDGNNILRLTISKNSDHSSRVLSS